MASLSTFVRGRTQLPAPPKPDGNSRPETPLFSSRRYSGSRADADAPASNPQPPVSIWHARRLGSITSPNLSRSSTTERIYPAEVEQNGKDIDTTSWDERNRNLPSAWDTDAEGIDDTVSELQISTSGQVQNEQNLQNGVAHEDDIKEEEDDAHVQTWPEGLQPAHEETLTERNADDYHSEQPYDEFGPVNDHNAETEIPADQFSELMQQAANMNAMMNAQEAMGSSRFGQSNSNFYSKNNKRSTNQSLYEQNRPYSPQESYPPTTPGGSDDEVELVSATLPENTAEYQKHTAPQWTPRKRQDAPGTAQKVYSTPKLLYDRQRQRGIPRNDQSPQPRSKAQSAQVAGRRGGGANSPFERPSSASLPLRGPIPKPQRNHHRAGSITPDQHLPQSADSASMDASAESGADDTLQSLTSRADTEVEEVKESLDYDPSRFSEMDYSELRDQPFDSDPNAPPSVFPPEMEAQALSERINLVIARPREQQRRFFSSLTIDEWEDCGDLFVERFGELIAKMKDTRRAKRKALAAFEDDIAVREETVKNKKISIDEALQNMRRGGQDVLRGNGKG
ncbi:hypothetical protein L228DRAFT_244243 [Xylona heveae TC161]|uniref:Extracellular mutant protein 11 C-terminal domain-containing protein n=1 Tax=Xylona heveae (strain CBS 132557 / TC161) TaxID=1328760 RepID=A0A165IUH8_XYLHT|nr:hypothetical protein L228DRAFT_244243 [Xylona heveae TC161]KZF25408.1 hypothetical protein L228DRAFT_244243 [Xylona heveae TC161]